MKIQKAIYGLIILGTTSIASATLVNLGTYGGKEYVYQNTALDYQSAKQEAISLGGYLVCINDSAENDWLISVLSPMKNEMNRVAWIGLTNPGSGWQWLSGETVSYTNWRPAGVGFSWAEPTGEDTGQMYLNAEAGIPLGLWSDEPHTWGPYPAIYEGVPEPATVGLLGLGSLVFLSKRRSQ
jgi:hypothetical protein